MLRLCAGSFLHHQRDSFSVGQSDANLSDLANRKRKTPIACHGNADAACVSRAEDEDGFVLEIGVRVDEGFFSSSEVKRAVGIGLSSEVLQRNAGSENRRLILSQISLIGVQDPVQQIAALSEHMASVSHWNTETIVLLLRRKLGQQAA